MARQQRAGVIRAGRLAYTPAQRNQLETYFWLRKPSGESHAFFFTAAPCRGLSGRFSIHFRSEFESGCESGSGRSESTFGSVRDYFAAIFECCGLDNDAVISVVEWSITGEISAVAPDEVTIVVAADSGAVANVINPSKLPAGCVPTGANGKHFVGASGEHIERYGEVDTVVSCSHCNLACAWQAADVTRALHSISKVAGPEHGPGVHEVFSTKEKAVFVPAGFVEEISKQPKAVPLLEYYRKSNVYLAEIKLSSFTRQARAE